MFDSLLDESHFVKKKTAQAKAEGRVEERAEEIKALRRLILKMVQIRFPALAQQAEQKLAMVSGPEQLHTLIEQIAAASDETAARDVLSMWACI